MTSGVVTIDQSIPWSSPSNSWYGSKYDRSWTGTDAPKRIKYPRIKVTTTALVRGRIVPVTWYIRDPAEPALIKRKFSEHPYQKIVQDYWSNLVVKTSGGTGTVASFDTCNSGFTAFAARDRVLLRAQANVRSRVQGTEFNAAVALGEMSETLTLITANAVRVAKALHHLRRGDWTGTVRSLFEKSGREPLRSHLGPRPKRKVLRDLSGHWLELQYGWLPLLSDVKSAAEAFAAWRYAPLRFSVRSTAKEELTKGGFSLNGQKSFARQTSKAAVKVTFKEAPSLTYKLGLTDPLTVAWELVPFSFVVDWFLPIGQYLEASSACRTLSVESVVTSRKDLSIMTIPFTRESRYMQFFRDVSGTWPSPKFPRFIPLSEALSVKRTLNALSLLVVGTRADFLTPTAR